MSTKLLFLHAALVFYAFAPSKLWAADFIQRLKGQELGINLGLSTVEEGDDGQRPAVLVGGYYDTYYFRAFYFGRTFGPVRERNLTLNINRTFAFSPLANVYWSVGGALVRDSTLIQFEREDLAEINKKEINYNLGASLGVYWQVPQNYIPTNKIKLRLCWESSVFPAGIVGGLFLSTGRRQFLSLEVGTGWLWQ